MQGGHGDRRPKAGGEEKVSFYTPERPWSCHEADRGPVEGCTWGPCISVMTVNRLIWL